MAYVVRNQCPMLFTFDEEQVEWICQILGESIIAAHDVYDMFSNKEEEESLW